MSYGDFSAQITGRGALTIVRSRETKAVSFEYKGQFWQCPGKNQTAMASDLADGYEMEYCLGQFCEKLDRPPPAPTPPSSST